MRISIALFFLFFTLTITYAQDPQIIWENGVGGDHIDELLTATGTTDGGVIGGGRSRSGISGDKSEGQIGGFGYDYWVVKLDNNGVLEWENTIGGDNNDHLNSIIQTSDGGYLIGGETASDISGDKDEDSWGWDYWVLKLNSSGVIVWQNTIGGTGSDYLMSVAQTSEGGFILAGHSNSDASIDKTENSIGFQDYWVVKIDAVGEIEWDHTIGGTNNEYVEEIIQTSDGGYMLVGNSYSDISGDKTEDQIGSIDFWIVKLDATGEVLWDNTIGGFDSDYLETIIQTSDGGYLIGGQSVSDAGADKEENSMGESDYWVLKLDQNGSIVWQNTIGGNRNEYVGVVMEDADGGYLVGGGSNTWLDGDKTDDTNGGFDYWVLKLNSTGNIVWQNSIGGTNHDIINKLIKSPDGDYILVGDSASDASGDKSENGYGHEDYWFVKISNLLQVDDETLGQIIKIVPNPGIDVINIDTEDNMKIEAISILDLNGSVILKVSDVMNLRSINISGLSSGVYFIQISSGGKTTTKKFIKE